MHLAEFNEQQYGELSALLSQCCGAQRWVQAMLEQHLLAYLILLDHFGTLEHSHST